MRNYDINGKIVTKYNNTHWVYALKDDYTNMIYIGETKCLASRLNNHINGKGSLVTKEMENIELIALYKVPINMDFEECCNYLDLENEITDYYIFLHDEYDVYGGCKTNIDKKYTIQEYDSKRPTCHCNIPCEIYKKDSNYIFTCAYKNVEYMSDYINNDMICDTSCDFYSKIKDDREKCIRCCEILDVWNVNHGQCYECYEISLYEKKLLSKKCIL